MSQLDNNDGRKHFEAALGEFARIHGYKAQDLRQTVKWIFIRAEWIKKSTTEFSDDQLKCIGELLGKYNFKIRNTPPSERGVPDLKKIFNIE